MSRHSAFRPLDCHACQWIKLRLMAAGVTYWLALAAIVHDHRMVRRSK